MDLSDRVALVTGGGTGIGKAIAFAMAEEGARVVIASRNMERLRGVAEELRARGHLALALELDVNSKTSIQECAAQLEQECGCVDILVNNAGVSGMTPVHDKEDQLWHTILSTNLTGVYLVTKEVVSMMTSEGRGRIINMSSVLGKFGVPGYLAYCASKHGLIGLTKALALELVSRNVTVNAVCPGWVETEMAQVGIEQIARNQGITAEAFTKQALSSVPIRRFLEPEEVARLTVYLASDKAAGITGQALNICGGQVMT